MITENKIFILLSFVISFLTGFVSADDINQPSYKRFRLTAEELNQLDEIFQEFHQKLDNFLELNRQADKERPGLIATEVAFFRLRHISEDHEFPGYDELTAFTNKIKPNTPEGQRYGRLYKDCEIPFSAKIAADAVQDPNLSRELKAAYLLKYRHTYGNLEDGRKDMMLKFKGRETLTDFNADEPNDQILWENIKKHIIETSNFYEQQRRNLLSQVPVFFAEASGYSAFSKEMKTWTGAWIRLYAPRYIFQPLREVSDNSAILARYYMLKQYLDKQSYRKYEELRKNLSWDDYRLFLEGKLERVSDNDYCQNKFLHELINEFFSALFVGY